MTAATMTPDQRQRLLTAIAQRRDWLKRLQERMRAMEWNPSDDTYRATLAAIAAMDRLLKAFVDAVPPR